MAEKLAFVGLSADGSVMDLADSTGTAFTLDVDERVTAALNAAARPDRPSGSSVPTASPAAGRGAGDAGRRRRAREESALETLSPRDIQALVRAGADPVELAQEHGMSLDRVERYAGPPLAERAWVSQQARAVTVRRAARGAASAGSTATLESVVLEAAAEAGTGGDEVAWDAWRNDDGRWTVTATFPRGTSSEEWVWSFDPRTGSLHEAGDAPALLEAVATTSGAAEPPTPTEPSDSSATASRSPSRPASGPASPEPEAAESGDAARGRRARRASVPTWDEILFGAGQPES